MQLTLKRPAWSRLAIAFIVALALLAPVAMTMGAAEAQDPPYDGNSISPGLGPTYGEPWCASAEGENVPQTDPLAIIPYAAIACSLDKFEDEAAANGVPDRFDWWSLGKTDTGRDIWAVVINAQETRDQRRDFERWRQLRRIQLTDPHGAQALLDQWGSDVKMPVFIEANIHGGEREGTDAVMQAIRDLVTLPRGTNAVLDKILDNTVLAIIPTTNPDGRVAGTRANFNNFDMNRDFMLQSQPEIQLNTAFQLDYLAPVGLMFHGYVNPTLVDGLTKPHNFGLEYDLFLKWNQPRLDVNEAALAAVGLGITRPVNQFDASGGGTNGNPAIAEGWDDWGPFYTQTYAAFFGVDGSTWEVCSNAACGGRLGSKKSAYVGFYSSIEYWTDNKAEIMWDQSEIFRRGADDEERPNCCDDPSIQARGFDEANHNWMHEYPEAYIIPWNGGAVNAPAPLAQLQRSEPEANRLAQFLVDNAVEVERATAPFTWNGTTYPERSYIVWMDQPLRGLAENFLGQGVDISERITQLYAPPGAWSHLTWGSDIVEVPAGDETFNPSTGAFALNPLQGGLRGSGRVDWYALKVDSPTAVRTVNSLLAAGVTGDVAEAPFTTTFGVAMPAGSLIFPASAATQLKAAGRENGLWFEASRATVTPPTTELNEPPRIAILAAGTTSDIWFSLRNLGFDVDHLAVTGGTASINTAPTDPLLNYDVIYNSGTGFPTGTANATAQARIAAFFARGGGYVGSLNSGATFLTGGTLVSGLTYASQTGSGIARWDNTGGASSPVTGALPAEGYVYNPSPMSRLSAVPADATVAGRLAGTPDESFVAGLWRSRAAAFTDAPIIAHGNTTAASRWAHFANNPFSRADAEGLWSAVGSAIYWSNLTDG